MGGSALAVLYQDAHYVVVCKPAGLLVHPTPEAAGETDTLVTRTALQLGIPQARPNIIPHPATHASVSCCWAPVCDRCAGCRFGRCTGSTAAPLGRWSWPSPPVQPVPSPLRGR
jgi:hypothetical protein